MILPFSPSSLSHAHCPPALPPSRIQMVAVHHRCLTPAPKRQALYLPTSPSTGEMRKRASGPSASRQGIKCYCGLGKLAEATQSNGTNVPEMDGGVKKLTVLFYPQYSTSVCVIFTPHYITVLRDRKQWGTAVNAH
jgi:hypothetical protein